MIVPLDILVMLVTSKVIKSLENIPFRETYGRYNLVVEHL